MWNSRNREGQETALCKHKLQSHKRTQTRSGRKAGAEEEEEPRSQMKGRYISRSNKQKLIKDKRSKHHESKVQQQLGVQDRARARKYGVIIIIIINLFLTFKGSGGSPGNWYVYPGASPV